MLVRQARRTWTRVGARLGTGLLAGMLVAAVPVTTEAGGVRAAADVELSASARQWLDQNGPLRVGWTSFGPPIALIEDGVPVGGYGVDLWDLAALKLGFKVEHVNVGAVPNIATALADGTVDVAGGFGPRADLAEVGVAAPPMGWASTAFVGGPDSGGLTRGGFAGATATTIPGSPLEVTLLEEFPEVAYVETETPAVGLQAVADGEIDLYFGPLAAVGYQMTQLDLDLVPIGDAVEVVEITPWAPGDSVPLEIAETAMRALTDAERSLIHVRWTGFDLSDPADDAGVPVWALPVALTVVGAVVVLSVFVLVLRRRVRAATAELRAANEALERGVEERTGELGELTTQLRRSNRALRRFATTAAHDLKSPIAAISGIASLLGTVQLDEEKQAELLERISTSALRLGSMVDAMLMDAVRVSADVDAVDGPAFGAWVQDVCSAELAVVGGSMTVEVDAGPIDANVEVLRRCAVNLISNAVKYAVNEQGLHVHVALSRADDAWVLVVADNGQGIPRPLWSKVFESGTRLVHDERGFGLGLAAIRDLVQGAGGSISIGDAAAGGARFTIMLPATPVENPVPSAGDRTLGTAEA